jgi:hypothetical protein
MMTCGSQLIILSYDQLSEGTRIAITQHKDCDSSNIYMILKDERLYVGAEFKSQSGQNIGSIV